MKKFTLDIGKLIKNKKKISNLIERFDVIIFDLDETIYPLSLFDQIVFKEIILMLKKKIKLNYNKSYNYLITNKRTKKKLFDCFIKKFKLKINKKILVNFYQNFKPKNKKNITKYTILDILKKYKNKKLFLVTEGHLQRQKNKIAFLGIKKFFKKIIILDGRYNRNLKPSTLGLGKIKKFLNTENTLYIGDSIKDKKLAENLKVNFYKFDISRYYYYE